MARPKLNALPQDSILRAHLRRQADWPDDAPRLTGRETGQRQRRALLADIDRIGRSNHLRGQAAIKREQAAEIGEAAKSAPAGERETLLQRVDDLTAQAVALEADADGLEKAPDTAAKSRPPLPRK